MAVIPVQLPLIMSDRIRGKLEGRNIYEEHLDEMVEQDPFPTHARRGRGGALELYGRDRGGRYLLLVLYESRDYEGEHVVATCRDMNDAERRLYQTHVGA